MVKEKSTDELIKELLEKRGYESRNQIKKFIMKKTANKCSKNSSIFEMGMLLYIKRKRIHVRKICSDIIDQRIRAIFICLT